jgi:Mn-dependent DtxR family transcriptional regulator
MTDIERMDLRDKKEKAYWTMKQQWQAFTPDQESRFQKWRDVKHLISEGLGEGERERGRGEREGGREGGRERMMQHLVSAVLYAGAPPFELREFISHALLNESRSRPPFC